VKKMRVKESLSIRFKQRQKYLEDPNFERLSDILTDKNIYSARRDDYIFLHLLYGHARKTDTFPTQTIIENAFLENYKRNRINWSGVYEYYKARIESINNDEWFDEDDCEIEDAIYILEKHKNKIFKNYTTF